MKKLLFLIALLVVSVQVVQAQTITISGTVKDADTEEAVIGASIVVKGTTTGTITDLDGNFSLAVSEGATIVVSSIGYNDYEFVASSTATTLAIVLKHRQNSLMMLSLLDMVPSRKKTLVVQ